MKKYVLWLVIVVLLIAPSVVKAEDSFVMLLTESEGAMQEGTHYGFGPSQVLENTGPAVEIVSPDMEHQQKSPFMLKVRFTSKKGTSVDLKSLKVEALKFIDLDITSRVRPHATVDGILIEQAKVPSGTHKIKLSIGDTKGGLTQQVYVVKVL